MIRCNHTVVAELGAIMANDGGGSSTLGDRLRRARAAAVVGRDAELALLQRLVAASDRRVAVVAVHGPAGVGKSTLLRALGDLASGTGITPVLVDGADVAPNPESLLAAIASAAGGQPTSTPPPGLPPRALLLLDTVERLAPLETWLREELIPTLPADAVVVTAGRTRPSLTWRTAPGWGEMLAEVPLRNLEPIAATDLLRSRGVPDEEIDALAAGTHGHPLALVVAADLRAELRALPGGTGVGPDATTGTLLDHPDATARLLGRFLDDVTDSLQRSALETAGHVRRVDRRLLATVLEIDHDTADGLLTWLRARPYTQVHADGLTVHDLVRDVLDRDLAWRDRDAFERLHRAIRSVIIDRIATRTGDARLRATFDLLDLHRSNADAAGLYGLDALGSLRPRVATAVDDDAVRDLVTAANGAGQAGAVVAWRRAQPGSLRLFVDHDDIVAGLVSVVRLDQATDSEIAGDPVAATVVGGLLPSVRRMRPGEPTLLQRPGSREAPPTLGPVSDMVAATSLELWAVPRLGWAVNVTPWEDVWAPLFTYIGFQRLGQTNESDGRPVAVWARDFARSPYRDWLDSLSPVELGLATAAPVASPVALAQSVFDRAVRSALRDLRRPDRLAANPLVGCRLVAAVLATGGPADAAAVLADRLRSAVAMLDDDARDRRGARAVDRTYVRAAGTQERAADILGLPFSTYRRHLAAGIERVVEVLWTWELEGVPPDHDPWATEPGATTR